MSGQHCGVLKSAGLLHPPLQRTVTRAVERTIRKGVGPRVSRSRNMGLTAGCLLWEGSALLIGDGFAWIGDEQGKSFRHRGTVPLGKTSWFLYPIIDQRIIPGGRFKGRDAARYGLRPRYVNEVDSICCGAARYAAFGGERKMCPRSGLLLLNFTLHTSHLIKALHTSNLCEALHTSH